MKNRRTSYKRHKNILLFVTIIFIFGIISGLLFYFNQDINVRKTLLLNVGDIFSHNVFDLKNIFIHIGLLLVVIATSFLFLGIPILLLILFFEGIAIGFILPIFISLFKWKAFFTFGMFFLLTKLVYLLILMYFFIISISFFKEYLSYLKTRKIRFFHPLKKMFFLCIFVLLNDLLIYFVFNKALIFLF